MKRPAVKITELTDKIDRVVLNRFLGIPVFLAAMWFVFKLTFDVSAPFADWLDGAINGPLTRWVEVAFVYQTILAWSVALLIYQGGTILGIGG